MQNKTILTEKWNNIRFQAAWEKQDAIFKSIIQQKRENRSLEKPKPTHNYLIFCEHPHVFTLGKSGDKAHLLLDDNSLKQKNIDYFPINRGGDITYHGPGQLVGYPILDLENFFCDLHKYLRTLEQAIIHTLAEWNIEADRIEGLTGVWVDTKSKNPRKICAMGIRSSHWVTMHGFALNVHTDLAYFDYIVPCGIKDKGVTSMAAELDAHIDMNEVEAAFTHHFYQLFEVEEAVSL
ncbi:MAG: lipoyl(octanoyl) transferase LipB [Bernardetiaceae bacterium]|nr:lipoyl(octanoyl) transferase LipB [Bernardetiaceae bacterium]